jgi:hypothetical protein
MEFKYIDGQKQDTYKLPDMMATHIEALEKCRKILVDAGLSFFIWSTDKDGGGSGAVSIPDDAKEKIRLLDNADKQFKASFKNGLNVSMCFVHKETGNLVPFYVMLPEMLKNLENKDI